MEEDLPEVMFLTVHHHQSYHDHHHHHCHHHRYILSFPGRMLGAKP